MTVFLYILQTGTLTEDGLDLYAVIPFNSTEKFGRCCNNIADLPVKSPLVQALASCHSLTSIQGELKGDPLDLKMFEFTQWVIFLMYYKNIIIFFFFLNRMLLTIVKT